MKLLFSKRYKHLKRLKEILQVISKEGLGFTIDYLGIDKTLKLPWHIRQTGKTKNIIPMASRVRVVLEQLGPTFIKLGQVLSTRADLLPPGYLKELELLQDNIPPLSFEQMEKVIEEELVKPIKQVFSEINNNPIASASIGQVYKASLVTGEQVIIKVQRPGISKIIETDLEIISDLAHLLEERTNKGKLYKYHKFTTEFAKVLREELDYRIEADHAERIWSNFQGDETVCIPKIFREYSNYRILVQEYKAGIKISEGFGQKQTPFNKKKVATRLVNAVCQQVLIDGFFHADLHPGNIAIGKDDTVIFMDFGMMGRLDHQTRESLISLLLNLINKDIDGIILLLSDLGSITSNVNKQQLKRGLYLILDRYYYKPLFEIKLKNLLREILSLSESYQITFPEEMILTARTLILLESIIEQLDPEINFIELVKPFTPKLIAEKLSLSRIKKTISKRFFSLSRFLLRLPEQLGVLLEKAEEGNLKLILEPTNFTKLIQHLNTVGNRLSFSLIVSSIIIGSSLIAQKTTSAILGPFHLAELGFIIAVLMGLWLLVSIIRSGKV
jgi:ubiquinone biosynthesis protein